MPGSAAVIVKAEPLPPNPSTALPPAAPAMTKLATQVKPGCVGGTRYKVMLTSAKLRLLPSGSVRPRPGVLDGDTPTVSDAVAVCVLVAVTVPVFDAVCKGVGGAVRVGVREGEEPNVSDDVVVAVGVGDIRQELRMTEPAAPAPVVGEPPT